MPRPERPLDASAGPRQEFAAALRTLRAESGNPPYREMAVTAHVSKASLSAAAAGHRLPTWEVARAYVTACGGDAEEWHDRWLAARQELGHPVRLTAAPPRRRLLTIGFAALLLTILALAAAAVWYTDEPNRRPTNAAPATSGTGDSPARFVGGSEPLADNADPKKTGCADDPTKVTTLDAVQVTTLNNELLGIAQLRHVELCNASWGRFEPSDRLTYLPGKFTVTITAHRPATGTVGTPFTIDFDGQPVFGNILLDTAGCVGVTVEIVSPHGNGAATTACRR